MPRDLVVPTIYFFVMAGFGSLLASHVLVARWRKKGVTALRRTAFIWGALGVAASLFYLAAPDTDNGWFVEESPLAPREIALIGFCASVGMCVAAYIMREARTAAQFLLIGVAAALWVGGVASYMSVWAIIALLLVIRMVTGIFSFAIEFAKHGNEALDTFVSTLNGCLPLLYLLVSCVVVGLAWTLRKDVRANPSKQPEPSGEG
jgi:hypothetical protein